MKNLKSEKGSVILMTLVVAVVFALVVMDLSSRFVNIVKEHRRFAVSNENIRVADELSKVLSHAYEYATQVGAAGCVSPKLFYAYGTGADVASFCFNATGSSANCVISNFNGNGQVCINPSTPPQIVAQSEREVFRLEAFLKVSRPNTILQAFVPESFAFSGSQPAMPPAPVFTPNRFTDFTCTGASGDPAICRRCGPGTPNICAQVEFCPSDKTTCLATEKIKIDFMIERSVPASATPSCAPQAMSWSGGGSICNGSTASTSAGGSASVNDFETISTPGTGSATFQCNTDGTWNVTPITSACSVGSTALCWTSAVPADNGKCAPTASCTVAGATLPNAPCYTDNSDGTVAPFTRTLTCTNVASASDPSCQQLATRYYCFTAGTGVTMFDGTKKAIEKIHAGERVLSFNDETSRFESRKVLAGIHHPRRIDRIYNLQLDNGETVESNGEHRIFVTDLNSYTTVSKLIARFESGEKIHFRGDDGESRELVHVSSRVEDIALFNLTIEKNHNYFASGVLVHNEKILCSVQTADQCTGVQPPCFADYSYPRFFKCQNVSQSVVNAFNTCLATVPDLCP